MPSSRHISAGARPPPLTLSSSSTSSSSPSPARNSTMAPALVSPNSAASALLAVTSSSTSTPSSSSSAAAQLKVLSPKSRQIYLDLSDDDDDDDKDDQDDGPLGDESDATESESDEQPMLVDHHPPAKQGPARRRPVTKPVPLPLPTSIPSQATLTAMAFEQQVVATAAAIHAAKRVVIVTGAGISVSAGIPDFRSESGLYNLIKLQNPGTVVKGQDLFDASLFRTDPTRRLFYSFMAGLRDACTQAHPTPVHAMMRDLDKRGKLLRCYTQNIDGLEERAGVGMPVETVEADVASQAQAHAQEGSPNRNGLGKSIECIDLRSSLCSSPSSRSSSPCPPPAPAPAPAPASATAASAKHPPTVIQLHGTLTHVRCVLCSTRLPFTSTLSSIFAEGDPPACPACMHDADMRAAANKRARATGTLRPDVVLYNEPNPNGDAIADVLGRDLRRRPDVVLVMGTSLKVHGIKRLVRDLAAAARGTGKVGGREERESDMSSSGSSSMSGGMTSDDEDESAGARAARSRSRGPRVPLSSLPPSSSPARPSSSSAASRPKVILVNKTALPAKEWGPVFDTCVTGADADEVVARWMSEWARLDRKQAEARAKREAAKERRLAGGVEKGQTRLVFPVVKQGGSAAAAVKVAGKPVGDEGPSTAVGKAVSRSKSAPAVPARAAVPLSVKARSGNENAPPTTTATAPKKGATKTPAAPPAPPVQLETKSEVIIIGSSSEGNAIDMIERTPVRSRLRPRAGKAAEYA